MAEKEKPERDNPEQSKRFEETARELGIEDCGERFKKVTKKILRQRKLNPNLPPGKFR